MKIAILGGGFTGLTASYDLAKKGYDVTLFEKEQMLGGLAVGFRGTGWDWRLERAYHHLFASDRDILGFAEEIGFKDIFFRAPETASLYELTTPGVDNFRIFPVDTPQDFFNLPFFSWPEKVRCAAVLGFLKLSPYFSVYERETAKSFLINSMGEKGWKVLWEQLFRKKFGKYAEYILAAFIWARITKRTKNLGYMKGGFQTFTDFLTAQNKRLGVRLRKGTGVENIKKKGGEFVVQTSADEEIYDSVISTLPTQILSFVARDVLPAAYLRQFALLHYLHAVVLVLETEKPILDKTYWLNICTEKLPLMFVGQHTNFIDKVHYANHHLAYVGWYVDEQDKRMRMGKEELIGYVTPYLRRLSPSLPKEKSYLETYLFKAPYAQPVFDKEFVKNKPDFITPVTNFFIANLDMTYPYDRGTNYAVKLGREVAKLL